MKKFLAYILIILAFWLLFYIATNKPENKETIFLMGDNSYAYQLKENTILQRMGLALENIDHNNIFATLITLDENKNYFTIVDIISKAKNLEINLEIISSMKNKFRGNYTIICNPKYLNNISYIPNHCIDPNLTVDKKNLASLHGVLLENNYAVIIACYYKACNQEEFLKFYKEINGN
jgi:hypothetical protein